MSATTGEVICPWLMWTVLPLVVPGVLYVAGIGCHPVRSDGPADDLCGSPDRPR
ncbi:hypothetical protein [Pseudonocardia acidicola]|uniref:Uncharacterized protein n=1 Tax=Pseudonocardia acidicola TaxID=2724939 RepID=A0ABX1SG88_9PSEU|nr:hypothetical protein [Pseudonocardia acidicola]NMH99498.1 hypothetical protein [Pseudonocardia acidicola]